VSTGGAPLFFNDEIFRNTTAMMGQCYSIQAVMHYDTFNDRIVGLPLDGGMTRNGRGCPKP
ncbi:MAG: hypothetical protein JKY56_23000, partial [Kofleriaceae bacterium]|nr:hypothetical protein [Kofleriaceae bacterium]